MVYKNSYLKDCTLSDNSDVRQFGTEDLYYVVLKLVFLLRNVIVTRNEISDTTCYLFVL